MLASRFERLTIAQGVTWSIRWPLTNPDGTPVDTTGWTVKAQIRPRPGASKVFHEWSTTRGNALFKDGGVELRVTPAESNAWNWEERAAFYDVVATLPDATSLRLLQGPVKIDAGVTR